MNRWLDHTQILCGGFLDISYDLINILTEDISLGILVFYWKHTFPVYKIRIQ